MNQVQKQWQISIMICEKYHVPSNQWATKDEKKQD